MIETGISRKLQLNKLEELWNEAFENSQLAELCMKELHDLHIVRKRFHEGQNVILYDSRLYPFPGKLKSRWTWPFVIRSISTFGVIEIKNLDSAQRLTVNGDRLKPYQGIVEENEGIEDLADPPSPDEWIKVHAVWGSDIKRPFFLICCEKHMESTVY